MAQSEKGANNLLSSLAISFQQQQLNVTRPRAESVSPCDSPITTGVEDSKRETLLVFMTVLQGSQPTWHAVI